MKSTLLLFTALLLLLIAANSCIKEKKKVFVPVDTDLKAHYDFKVGSYWIYRDSATGVEDSFVVTERSTDSSQSGDYYLQSIYSRIRQYHNNVILDTPIWAFSLRNTYLFFGYNQDAIQVNLQSAEITDGIILGVPYQNIRKYKDGIIILDFKDNIGLLRFNWIYNTKELVRYKTLQ